MVTTPSDSTEDAYLLASRDEDFISTFWARVSRSPECWIWEGGKSGAYGQLQYRRRRLLAHRLSWCLANGAACPSDLVIRHRCDNPPCVNPGHLQAGSISQNVRDAYERRRRTGPRKVRGTLRPNAVLDDATVTDLRRAARSGVSLRSLAATHSVCYQTVYRAVRGIGWTHVLEPAVPPKRIYPPHARNFVRNNPEIVAEARRLRDRGLALQEIADQLGITKTAAFRCCRTDAKELQS